MADWIYMFSPLMMGLRNGTTMSSLFDNLDGKGSNESIPTSSSASQMLPRVIEFFVPGYGLLSNGILDILGFDINLVLYVIVAFYASRKIRSLFDTLTAPLLDWATHEFTFDSTHTTYPIFIKWAQKRKIGLRARDIRIKIEDADFDPTAALKDFDPTADRSLYSAPSEIKLLPSFTGHWFWYKRRPFRFSHQEKEQNKGQKLIQAQLWCVWWSNAPLVALWTEILMELHLEETSRTRICWPAPEQRRRDGWGPPWTWLASRSSRPIRTVILDPAMKNRILTDVADFLRNETSVWYAERGLPYRRGYLFVGPPGTGKTSLSFAIAGLFQLPVYVLSLQDPSIRESDLMVLFNALPDKSVIILEDIDSAGIKNRGISLKKNNKDKTPVKSNSISNDETDSRVSLSGLLNVIDGIASKEGRILIMTTNALETLDPALIRPGRIDLTIEFKLLTPNDAKTLFKNMYISSGTENVDEKMTAKLDDLASEFSSAIPEDSFSPAEVQGFLLMHKHTPEKAVEGIEAWVTETKAKKKAEAEKRKKLEAEEALAAKKKEDKAEAKKVKAKLKKKLKKDQKKAAREEQAKVNGVDVKDGDLKIDDSSEDSSSDDSD